MKTTKPFSTISYNSEQFLKSQLDKLVTTRKIAFYTFVFHYAEADENKNHRHLIIFPNGQIQTDSVTDLLQELDLNNPLKPLGVMPWRSSKWDDWYLYASHDSAYLASKGQARKHHYQESDFVCSDSDYLHELISTIDRTKYAKTQEFVEKISNGVSFIDLLKSGQIPAPQFNQWRSMYEFIQGDILCRNDRITHSPFGDVDNETGELITPVKK